MAGFDFDDSPPAPPSRATSDATSAAAAGPPVFSVGRLVAAVRLLVERQVGLVWVAGEISGCTRAASGHVYFTLKDADAQVRCVLFRLKAQAVGFALRDGLAVEVRAVPTMYEARGEFQLNVDTVRLAGLGALYERFAKLKARLEAAGWFAPARKRPLPAYPRAVGIVTSRHAAALRDVLTTLRRRSPALRIVLYPAAVQGPGAALSHSAIATVFSLEEIDGELYIISELVRGRTLREELRDGPLPSDQLVPALISIGEALAAAHEKGIVHRDLKPENILRRDDGHIKVLDFGLARPTAPRQSTVLTEEGTILGTPGYMAPEQLTPGADIDGRADLFAFGVIAWELATGEHPLGTDSAAIIAKMTDLLEGRTPALSRALPLPGLDRIVRRCMRRAPTERYPSAEALLVDLRTLHGVRPLAMPAVRHDSFWWWQGHQLIVSAVNAAAAAAVWGVRQWVGKPGGTILFLMSLAFATISVALRLNLFFASRVHPLTLIEHRARVFPPIAVLDTLLAGTLLAAATIIAAADHDGMAAILIALAAVMLASLSLIEPATTAAAGLIRPDAAKKTPTTVR